MATICFTIARPRPVPPLSFERLLSERLLSMINNVIRLSELDGTKEKVLLGPVQSYSDYKWKNINI